MSKNKLLFTGGHHNSALPVIDLLKQENEYEIDWVGKKYRVDGKNETPEYLDITKRNINFYHLVTGKLFRTTSIRYFHLVLFNLVKIPVGFISALYYLLKINPQIIVSFGGYIALPVVILGKLLGKKVLTHEQTVVLGVSNQIISKFSNKILTTWPIEAYDVKANIKDKMISIGLPVNKKLFEETGKIEFEDRKKKILYITGGKTGSDYLNSLIIKNIDYLSDNYNLIWSIGSNHSVESIKAKVDVDNNSIYLKTYFKEDEIYKVYNSLDLAITRGGAHTVYELLAKGKKAIVIPIPWSSKNEQYKNAEILRDYGLGVIYDQENDTNERFLQLIEQQINKKDDEKVNFNPIHNSAEYFVNEIKNI